MHRQAGIAEKLNSKPALKITINYIIVGVLWILFSDELVTAIFLDQDFLKQVQTIKGWFFVIVTGTFLYLFLKIQFDQIRSVNESLASKNTFINQIYNGINCLIFVWDEQGKIVDCNQYFSELLGYAREEIIGQNWRFIVAEEQREFVYLNVVNNLRDRGTLDNSRNLVVTKSGRVLDVLWNDRMLGNDDNQNPLTISFGIDVTKEREMELERNTWLFYDKLTQSGNAVKLEMDCNDLIQVKKPFTLILADISKLSQVNNQFGIHTGDMLIQYVHNALEKYFKSSSIYRWHSGSFVILSLETQQDEIEKVLKQIEGDSQSRVFIDGKEVEVKLKFGMTQYPWDGLEFEGLINFAAYANLYVKRRGTDTYSFFNEQMRIEMNEELEAEMKIRTVLDMNFLEIYMQPLYHVESGEIRAAETLLRSYTQSFYYESIIDFIKIAERTGLIVDVDFWVIENVFKWINEEDIHGKVEICINLSAQSLASVRLLPFVMEALLKHNIDPRQITFELTEHSVVQDYVHTNLLIDELKRIGFSIALDDFGSEYSSLKYLSKLKFDSIKIDKAFIDGIAFSKVDRGIVQGIVELSKGIDLVVIAEGVEDETQFNILKELGCHYIQGYYIGRPEPTAEFLKRICLTDLSQEQTII